MYVYWASLGYWLLVFYYNRNKFSVVKLHILTNIGLAIAACTSKQNFSPIVAKITDGTCLQKGQENQAKLQNSLKNYKILGEIKPFELYSKNHPWNQSAAVKKYH